MAGILELLKKQVCKLQLDGVDLYVRPMPIQQALGLERVADQKQLREQLPVILDILGESICNEDGSACDKVSTMQALQSIGLNNLMALFRAVMQASGLGENQEDDLLKNLPARPDSSS